MKVLVNFQGVPFFVKVDKNESNFYNFVANIASQLWLDPQYVTIKFNNGPEVDRSYQWPIFKAGYYISEDINVCYKKTESFAPFNSFLDSLRLVIKQKFDEFFHRTTTNRVNRVEEKSDISRGYLDISFVTNLNLTSPESLTYNIICFITNGRIYFHVFDTSRIKGYPLPLLDPNNKSLRIDVSDTYLHSFGDMLVWFLKSLCDWTSNRFLSLPYEIKSRILKNVNSMADFGAFCGTCNFMAKFLHDNLILRTLFYRQFKHYPSTQDVYKEFKSHTASNVSDARRSLPTIPLVYFRRPSHYFMDQRPPMVYPGMIGGPRDMYPFTTPFMDPTRAYRQDYNPNQPDPFFPDPFQPDPFNPDLYQAWDSRGGPRPGRGNFGGGHHHSHFDWM